MCPILPLTLRERKNLLRQSSAWIISTYCKENSGFVWNEIFVRVVLYGTKIIIKCRQICPTLEFAHLNFHCSNSKLTCFLDWKLLNKSAIRFVLWWNLLKKYSLPHSYPTFVWEVPLRPKIYNEWMNIVYWLFCSSWGIRVPQVLSTQLSYNKKKLFNGEICWTKLDKKWICNISLRRSWDSKFCSKNFILWNKFYKYDGQKNLFGPKHVFSYN
jgi:hypothetical protein